MGKEEVQEEIQRIRLTLRSREIKHLEHVCAEIKERASRMEYRTRGPVRIPTKVLTVTTRRSPCGNGTNTYDRYEIRIHKRVLDIYCHPSAIKEITHVNLDTGVDVALIVNLAENHH